MDPSSTGSANRRRISSMPGLPTNVKRPVWRWRHAAWRRRVRGPLDGSVSMAAWLRHHCRMSNRDATALVHRGRFLDRFPAIAEAACDHVLSAGQTQALQSKVDAAVEPILHRQQAELVSIFAPLSVADTDCGQGLAAAGRGLGRSARAERSRTGGFVSRVPVDGALVGNFVLDDGCALEFEQAIRIAMTWDGTAETRSTDRRHADALFDVCAFFNANHTKPGTPRRRPHVELISEQSRLWNRQRRGHRITAHRLVHGRCVHVRLRAPSSCPLRVSGVVVRPGDAHGAARSVQVGGCSRRWTAGSPGVTARCRGATPITSVSGATWGVPNSTTWCCSAAATTT